MRTLALFILSLNFFCAYSQQVENGSFEFEQNGADVQAYPWSKCWMTTANTPDLYPGVYSNVTQPPSHGWSYLNMVVRENGTKEMIFGKIVPPMLTEECYRVSFDAMVSEQMVLESWGEIRDYTNPAALAIDLGDEQCHPLTTVITVEDLVPGSEWKQYSFVYQPAYETHGIRLRNYFIGPDYYYGHIFVDNFRIQKSGDTTYLSDTYVDDLSEIYLSMPNEEGYTYNWENTNVACQSCPSTYANLNETTTFIGSKQDSGGCFVEYFSIKFITPPVVPNVITPNNDHINDVFYIRNLPEKSSLTILNRWGDQVYHTNDYDNSWDGSFEGESLPDGVYFYSLNYLGKQVTGFLHISR